MISHLCVAQMENKHLLINIDETDAINAYNVASSQREWQVKGKLPGMNKKMKPVDIVYDGSGQLLVCDASNKCLHILAMDGSYMDATAQDLSDPFLAFWCKQTKRLILHHEDEFGECLISVIRVDI